MRSVGSFVSLGGHAVILFWGLVAFAPEPLESDFVEALPVEFITIAEVTDLTKGVRDAPEVIDSEEIVETPEVASEEISEAPGPVDTPVETPDPIPVPEIAEKPVEAKPEEPEPEPEPEPVSPDDSDTGQAPLPESLVGESDLSSLEPGDDPQAKQDYRTELQQWLQSHIRYPHRLKRRKVEGVVQVAFSIDTQGRLLEYALVKSSGVAGLDDAALQLLREAEPFPAIPDALGLNRYDVQVPVNYALQ